MTDHLYVSTACQHGQHESCRQQCKYCGNDCLCPHHALGSQVFEFSPETVVVVTRENTAHAVIEGGWVCNPDLAGPGDELTWAQTKDPEYKAWPAWPCQTCVGTLRRSSPS